MLSLETCEKLRDAGWEHPRYAVEVYCPTLEELLEAVREITPFGTVVFNPWSISVNVALNGKILAADHTDPSEAVAALWLKLKASDVKA